MNRAESFKTTEVGEVPDSWEVAQLGDVFDVKQGKALSPQARAGTSPRPFLRTSNVLWGRLDLSSLDQMDFTFDEAERLLLLPDDLLVCEGGEIGRTAIWKGAVKDCFYQNHIHRLRAKQSDIAPDFVMYWMQAAFLHLRLYGGIGNKTTIPNLSGARLKSLPVPLPPVPEQRAITAVLSKIQAALEVQEKIVATLKELKAATMAKLFREGLLGEPLKQTEIGEIPESWEVLLFGKLCRVFSGFAFKSSEYQKTGIPLIKIGNLQDGTIKIAAGSDYISDGRLKDATLARFILRPYDILIALTGATTGKLALVPPSLSISFLNQRVGKIEPQSQQVDMNFCYYLAQQPGFQSAIQQGILKSAQGNVSPVSIEAITVPHPSFFDQCQIGESLRKLEEREHLAAQKRTVLKSLFSSMLHLLMTGQVRVTPKMIALQRVADWAARGAKWLGKVDEKVLEQVVKRIVDAVAPEKIILFGSAARGEMRPDSDLDLLIVKSGVHRLATAQMIEHSLTGITIPTDIVVATPKDIEVHKNTIGLIYRSALQEGKIIYAA